MNNYLIKYKVATLAELVKSFSYSGYEFNPYSSEYWKCDAWAASKEIKAKTAAEARSKFIVGLMPLIEQFSVVSQCAFRLVANTYFIYKLNNNSEKIVYIYYVRSTDPVGLHFDDEEIAQLPKFKKLSNRSGLLYILEAANTNTFYARLALLIMAAEGLAGEEIKAGRKRTNKKFLKEILGDELYKKLYSEDRLRHVLIHGRLRDIKQQRLFEGLSDAVYKKIREYLRRQFDILLEENVVDPQRSFYGNFQYTANWWKFAKKPVLDLKELEEALDDRLGHNPKEREVFDGLVQGPPEY